MTPSVSRQTSRLGRRARHSASCQVLARVGPPRAHAHRTRKLRHYIRCKDVQLELLVGGGNVQLTPHRRWSTDSFGRRTDHFTGCHEAKCVQVGPPAGSGAQQPVCVWRLLSWSRCYAILRHSGRGLRAAPVGRANGSHVKLRGRGPRGYGRAARRLPACEARDAGGVTPCSPY